MTASLYLQLMPRYSKRSWACSCTTHVRSMSACFQQSLRWHLNKPSLRKQFSLLPNVSSPTLPRIPPTRLCSPHATWSYTASPTPRISRGPMLALWLVVFSTWGIAMLPPRSTVLSTHSAALSPLWSHQLQKLNTEVSSSPHSVALTFATRWPTWVTRKTQRSSCATTNALLASPMIALKRSAANLSTCDSTGYAIVSAKASSSYNGGEAHTTWQISSPSLSR